MSQPNPTPVPPSRDPVGHGRAATEGGILAALATVLLWALGLLPVEIPPPVAGAFSGLVVMIGTLAFSEWRNSRYNTALLRGPAIFWMPGLLGLLLVFSLGCVTFAGGTYKGLAGTEIVALSSVAAEVPLDAARCDAHKDAARALRDAEGDSKSLNAPFFAGQHIGELADRHARMGSICYEMAGRDAARGVSSSYRVQLRVAWLRAWRNGRALTGGPEGEE